MLSSGRWAPPQVETGLFPSHAHRFVGITPFLDIGFLRRLPVPRESSRLVSRGETFDRIGSASLPDQVSTWTLQQAAETPDPDEETPTTESPRFDVTTGLHAKTFVWETSEGASVLTGSANGTSAAFGGNVEFDVLLRGSASQTGVAALLGEKSTAKDDISLAQVIEPYTILHEDPQADPVYDAEVAIEAFHAQVAASGIRLVAAPEEVTWSLTAMMPPVERPDGLTTTVRPLGRSGGAHPWDSEIIWQGLAMENISPFLVLETELTTPDARVTRSCVVEGRP